MNTWKREILLKAFKFFDLAVVSLCFLISVWMVQFSNPWTPFSNFLSIRVKLVNIIIFLGFLGLWHFIFLVFGLYWSRRLSTPRKEIVDVIKATTTGSIAVAAASYLLHIDLLSPIFLVTLWAGTTAMIVASRFALRAMLHAVRRHGRNLSHVLVIGTNERAIRFAQMIERRPELGYCLAGFVDSDWERSDRFESTGYPLVADLDGAQDYIRRHRVDEIVVSLPIKSFYNSISNLIKFCDRLGVCVRYMSTLFEREETVEGQGEPFLARAVHDFRVDELDIVHLPVADTIEDEPSQGRKRFLKRFLDIFTSGTMLILLSPLFAAIAVIVATTSPGPVFFIQERVGLNRRRFRLFKFRTMVADAESRQATLEAQNESDGAAFKMRNDPRVTTIGRILRKTSLDELPQLLNVLLGDMSLVGPRPLPLRDFHRFEEDDHRRRFSVRPGITCLWQINGRSDTSFEDWMQYDLQYIDEWSLALDIKILLMTIPAVVRGAGAH